MKSSFKSFFLHTALGVVMVVVGLFFVHDVHAGYEVLPNLQINKIQLSISLKGDIFQEWKDRLLRRADKWVAEKGLRFAPLVNPLKLGEARLEVVLMPFNLAEGSQFTEGILGGTCPGKGAWFYDSYIALWEWTYVPRNPDTPMHSLIWKSSRPYPLIKEQITYEELEKELMLMLNEFIMEYKWANSSSAPE